MAGDGAVIGRDADRDPVGRGPESQRAHAGQLVRAIDVPVRRELGVFDNPYPEFDPKAFADEMKRAAAAHYGARGRRSCAN